MTDKRISKIRQLTSTDFKKLVETNTSYRDILLELGLPTIGGTARTLRKRIQEDGIDCSHIKTADDYRKRTQIFQCGKVKQINLEEILVENSTYTHGSNLKKNLLRKGLLENKCYECGLEPVWKDKKLSLQMDHINGIRSDNRLSNLRILCPNCHSQTPTYAGAAKRREPYHICKMCGGVKHSLRSKTCAPCRYSNPSLHRPSRISEDLRMIKSHMEEFGIKATSLKYDVAQSTILTQLRNANLI